MTKTSGWLQYVENRKIIYHLVSINLSSFLYIYNYIYIFVGHVYALKLIYLNFHIYIKLSFYINFLNYGIHDNFIDKMCI